MLRTLPLRLARMVLSLVGITVVTFLMMDLAPGNRAELAVAGGAHDLGAPPRAGSLDLLREQWGLVDPETQRPYSVWERYGHWLARASRLDFAGPGEDPAAFRRRILDALPVTLLLNAVSLGVALLVAVPLGTWLGLRAGSAVDRAASGAMFFVWGVPEFVVATLLLLAFAGGWGEALLPGRGLQSDAIHAMSGVERALDMAAHLVLPVTSLAIAPAILMTRFLRDSVAKAAQSEFVRALRGWGLPESFVRQRVRANGLSPLVTLCGVLLPGLVSGSIVVENVFSLPGLGSLAFRAAMDQEYPMVMALTLLVGVSTLLGTLLSDLLHRAIDPRVELR
ncbi:MAG: ABC transporter permease [Planctomycetota bacterium]